MRQWIGQTFSHSPQPVQVSKSILARLFTTFAAPVGQTLSHFLQAMQAFEQSFLASAPFRVLLQETTARVVEGFMVIIFLGQVLVQSLQPTQTRGFTKATPSLRHIAPTGQAFTQSPQPAHPKTQEFAPPKTDASALQVFIPS